jgi:hypothetical protein
LKVYKYRSGSKRDIEALMNNQFYSAPIESLNDIHEAKILINQKEVDVFDLLIKHFEPLAEGFKKTYEDYLKKAMSFGVYSLSKNFDMELLWAYYSNSYKGFCIEYDLDKLKAYQLEGEYFTDVDYQEDIPTLDVDDILKVDIVNKKLLATKSIAWKHEDECRIITGQTGLYYYYNNAISAIYFGHRTEENTIKLVMSVLKGKNIKYYTMTSENNSYKLQKEEIEDIFENESIYKYKTNVFQPYIDENIAQYEELIKKAIIVVEQEPMCEKVIDAYISQDKGTKDNPVFFVTYKDRIRAIPAINYFISKNELELIQF